MRVSMWSSIGVIVLLFGFASSVSAKEQNKSWEVDVYGDEAEVTYVPDGRDDVHVYDHNNHYNDRSYIEVEQPRYYGGYNHRERYDYGYEQNHYDYGRYSRRHNYDYRRHYRPRYRVEYHHRRW